MSVIPPTVHIVVHTVVSPPHLQPGHELASLCHLPNECTYPDYGHGVSHSARDVQAVFAIGINVNSELRHQLHGALKPSSQLPYIISPPAVQFSLVAHRQCVKLPQSDLWIVRK